LNRWRSSEENPDVFCVNSGKSAVSINIVPRG
jgi:hypothetical protein